MNRRSVQTDDIERNFIVFPGNDRQLDIRAVRFKRRRTDQRSRTAALVYIVQQIGQSAFCLIDADAAFQIQITGALRRKFKPHSLVKKPGLFQRGIDFIDQLLRRILPRRHLNFRRLRPFAFRHPVCNGQRIVVFTDDMLLIRHPPDIPFKLVIGNIMFRKNMIFIKCRGVREPVDLFLKLLELRLHGAPVRIRPGSVQRLHGKLCHPMKHRMRLIQRTVSDLHPGGAVLCIFRPLIQPSDQPPHFLGNGKPGRIIRRTVNPVPGSEFLHGAGFVSCIYPKCPFCIHRQ